MELCEKILSARKEMKMTQHDAALALDVKPRTYQRYERGEIKPKNRKMLEVVFNKPAGYFDDTPMDTKEQMEYIKAQTQALMAGGELSEEDQEAFMQELLEISQDAQRRKREEQGITI